MNAATKNNREGYTVIEMLVVVFIIGALAAMVLANFGTSRLKARNAQRMSDLTELQFALEQYYDDYHEYPVCTGGTFSTCDTSMTGTKVCICTGAQTPTFGNLSSLQGIGAYIHSVPQDPINIPAGQETYDYVYARGYRKISDTVWEKVTNGSKTDYILLGRLELASGVSMTAVSGNDTNLNNLRTLRNVLLGNE